jgi:HAD superfamily hydrolase (TIGR01459 family)
MVDPPAISPEALVERYDGFLLDAYGVLNDARGALQIGKALIAAIVRAQKPFAIVTNDASRAPKKLQARFEQFGYAIDAAQIVTSGDMLTQHLLTREGPTRLLLLGTADSKDFARAGGATLVPLREGAEADALAICDDDGFDFKQALEWCLSCVIRAHDHRRPFELLLANPDLVYPKSENEVGITAGSMAALLEHVLTERYGTDAPTFLALGKPEPAILYEGLKRLPHGIRKDRVIMVGDQVAKDVAAAYAAGIDSALVAKEHAAHAIFQPTWRLEP